MNLDTNNNQELNRAQDKDDSIARQQHDTPTASQEMDPGTVDEQASGEMLCDKDNGVVVHKDELDGQQQEHESR